MPLTFFFFFFQGNGLLREGSTLSKSKNNVIVLSLFNNHNRTHLRVSILNFILFILNFEEEEEGKKRRKWER